MTAGPVWLSASDVYAAATVGTCADALAAALGTDGSEFQGSHDPPRLSLHTPTGDLLIMPSTTSGAVGVKLVSVREQGSPRVRGVHVQFDPDTLAPVAVVEGSALTNLRTAGVSVLALRAIAEPDGNDLLVLGAGPQAAWHAAGIVAEWPVARVTIVSRRPGSADRLVSELGPSLAAIRPEVDVSALPADRVAETVARADIIVCATTSATPVLTAPPPAHCAVVAIGSHTPDARELTSGLLSDALVVVEDRATALREAGDIVLAVAEGAMTPDDIDGDLHDLVRGRIVPDSRPRVFKSVGMAWQDAVVAAEILRSRGAG